MDRWDLGQWAVLAILYVGWTALCVFTGMWLERIKPSTGSTETDNPSGLPRYMSDPREMATLAD